MIGETESRNPSIHHNGPTCYVRGGVRYLDNKWCNALMLLECEVLLLNTEQLTCELI